MWVLDCGVEESTRSVYLSEEYLCCLDRCQLQIEDHVSNRPSTLALATVWNLPCISDAYLRQNHEGRSESRWCRRYSDTVVVSEGCQRAPGQDVKSSSVRELLAVTAGTLAGRGSYETVMGSKGHCATNCVRCPCLDGNREETLGA